MSFWSELKRRNVFKVGAAYVIVAWLIVQVANTFFPILNLPDWALTLVASLLILGFPLALLFAWAFELTPDGLKRTHGMLNRENITRVVGRKLNYILVGVIVMAVVYILFDNLYLDRSVLQEAPKTIAVLPFENRSSDPEQEYFVDGLSEEFLNCLARLEGLHVTSKTSSFNFNWSGKTIQEIAEVLGVDYILEGSVRKAGDIIRITAQLIRAEDDFHLWSGAYNRELKDIFDIQEEIAMAVANELKVTLGIGKTHESIGATKNVEAYELYLFSQGQLNDLSSKAPVSEKDLNQVMESIDTAIALDPEYALAWALKAKAHIFYSIFGPSSLAAAEQDAAQRAVIRSIELEPGLAEAYMSLGNIKRSKCELIDAGYAFSKAHELMNESLSGNEFTLGHFYSVVGDFKKANELFEEMRRNDRLNKDVRSNYVLSFGLLGDIEQAEKEYEQGSALFGNQWSFGDLYITALRLGHGDIIDLDKIAYSDPIFDIAKVHLDSPEKGMVELRQIYASGGNLSSVDYGNIALWAAYYGDPEFSIDAIIKGVDIDATGLFNVWFPIMREVRQRRRFKEFVNEIGLVDYWNEFGWPDICHPTDDGDFVCD